MKTRTIVVAVLCLAAFAFYLQAAGRITLPPPGCVSLAARTTAACSTTTTAHP
ncbi:MAG TPA: hypothetical protein VJ140_05015 [Actinomycetota bacterium]|nr:hypothetical protein [Actinomycetota bacterium]